MREIAAVVVPVWVLALLACACFAGALLCLWQWYRAKEARYALERGQVIYVDRAGHTYTKRTGEADIAVGKVGAEHYRAKWLGPEAITAEPMHVGQLTAMGPLGTVRPATDEEAAFALEALAARAAEAQERLDQAAAPPGPGSGVE